LSLDSQNYIFQTSSQEFSFLIEGNDSVKLNLQPKEGCVYHPNIKQVYQISDTKFLLSKAKSKSVEINFDGGLSFKCLADEAN
jgi:hypothetical protein